MRNKFPGCCYYCGGLVDKGQGHFERHKYGGWRVIHAECVFKQRDEKGLTRDGKRSKLMPDGSYVKGKA